MSNFCVFGIKTLLDGLPCSCYWKLYICFGSFKITHGPRFEVSVAGNCGPTNFPGELQRLFCCCWPKFTIGQLNGTWLEVINQTYFGQFRAIRGWIILFSHNISFIIEMFVITGPFKLVYLRAFRGLPLVRWHDWLLRLTANCVHRVIGTTEVTLKWNII